LLDCLNTRVFFSLETARYKVSEKDECKHE